MRIKIKKGQDIFNAIWQLSMYLTEIDDDCTVLKEDVSFNLPLVDENGKESERKDEKLIITDDEDDIDEEAEQWDDIDEYDEKTLEVQDKIITLVDERLNLMIDNYEEAKEEIKTAEKELEKALTGNDRNSIVTWKQLILNSKDALKNYEEIGEKRWREMKKSFDEGRVNMFYQETDTGKMRATCVIITDNWNYAFVPQPVKSDDGAMYLASFVFKRVPENYWPEESEMICV